VEQVLLEHVFLVDLVVVVVVGIMEQVDLVHFMEDKVVAVMGLVDVTFTLLEDLEIQ
jgi:hypothetical protein